MSTKVTTTSMNVNPNEEGQPAMPPRELVPDEQGLTIITATIERPTLERTIRSVEAQQIKVPHIIVYDKEKRSAGLTKTQGAKQAKTEWIAFVDDDDSLDPMFTVWWQQNARLCDAMVFKCRNEVLNKIVPEPGYDSPQTLHKSHIGLALAVKRAVFLEHPYWNERDMGAPEDWEFIRWLKEETKYKIKVIDHVGYYIHSHGGRQ